MYGLFRYIDFTTLQRTANPLPDHHFIDICLNHIHTDHRV
jgi:hypothetical protein